MYNYSKTRLVQTPLKGKLSYNTAMALVPPWVLNTYFSITATRLKGNTDKTQETCWSPEPRCIRIILYTRPWKKVNMIWKHTHVSVGGRAGMTNATDKLQYFSWSWYVVVLLKHWLCFLIEKKKHSKPKSVILSLGDEATTKG